MRLKEVLCREPTGILQSYQHLERYVNDGSPSGENRTVNKIYSPQEGVERFSLPYISVSSEKCELFGNHPSDIAQRTIIVKEQQETRFFLHPDMACKFNLEKNNSEFQVFPTSSGRTICKDDSNDSVYIKLHYDGMLGRIIRKMNREKVSESIYFSEDLDHLCELGIGSSHFDYFPESLGLVTNINGQDFGLVVRDFNTRNQTELTAIPRIPWFSLFSIDKKNPNDPSILEQWVESKAGKNINKAREYVFKNFLEPVIDCYTFLSTKVGVVSDYNAQNLLVIPDENDNVDRIAFRDLHSFYLDSEIRIKNNLPLDCQRKINTQSDDPKDAKYSYSLRSLYFDHKFSDYLLEPIIKSFCKSFGDNPNFLTKMTKEYLLSTFDNIREYFYPYESGYRLPLGITQRDSKDRAILETKSKSNFR